MARHLAGTLRLAVLHLWRRVPPTPRAPPVAAGLDPLRLRLGVSNSNSNSNSTRPTDAAWWCCVRRLSAESEAAGHREPPRSRWPRHPSRSVPWGVQPRYVLQRVVVQPWRFLFPFRSVRPKSAALVRYEWSRRSRIGPVARRSLPCAPHDRDADHRRSAGSWYWRLRAPSRGQPTHGRGRPSSALALTKWCVRQWQPRRRPPKVPPGRWRHGRY